MGALVTKYAKECWHKVTGTSRVIPLPGGASVTLGQVSPMKIVVEDTDPSTKIPKDVGEGQTEPGITIKPPDQLQAKPVRLAWVPDKTTTSSPNSLVPPEDVIPEPDRAFLPPHLHEMATAPVNKELTVAEQPL